MKAIDTPFGKIQGEEYNGCLAFRGIRYAKASVGTLRFKPPEPVEPWSGVYNATEFGPSAPQLNMQIPDAPLQLPVEPIGSISLVPGYPVPMGNRSGRPTTPLIVLS